MLAGKFRVWLLTNDVAFDGETSESSAFSFEVVWKRRWRSGQGRLGAVRQDHEWKCSRGEGFAIGHGMVWDERILLGIMQSRVRGDEMRSSGIRRIGSVGNILNLFVANTPGLLRECTINYMR